MFASETGLIGLKHGLRHFACELGLILKFETLVSAKDKVTQCMTGGKKAPWQKQLDPSTTTSSISRVM